MASVALDGARIRMGSAGIFDLGRFMASTGWKPIKEPPVHRNAWACSYRRADKTIWVHSRRGMGDVIAQVNGRRIIAECRNGPLLRKASRLGDPLLTNTLGQALLLDVSTDDIVVAAVPDMPVFRRLAEAWRERPLVRRAGIRIALVARDGAVTGLDLSR